MNLVLRLKAKWWDLIANGQKTVELRLATDYWRHRLNNRLYDEIHLWRGYPPKTAVEKRLVRKWNGATRRRMTHPEFGPEEVEVFEVDLSKEISQ